MGITVRHCNLKVECHKKWDDLEAIRTEMYVRYCGECQSAVFHCTTQGQVDQHVLLKHCVAFERDDMRGAEQPHSALFATHP